MSESRNKSNSELKTRNDRVTEEPAQDQTEMWLGRRRERLNRLRQRRLVVIGSLAIVLVALLAFWLIWRSRKKAETAEEAIVVSVQVAKVERRPIALLVSALGTVFPREKAEVSAKIGAQIKQMSLLKNHIVKAGQVIAVLESRDLLAQRNEAVAALKEAQANERSVVTGSIPQTNAQDEKALRDARANVANARATYERRRVLHDKGGISTKDLEATQLALTQAETELRLAEQTASLRARSLNPNDRALAAARVAQAQQHLATLDAQLSYATIRAPITGVVTDQFQYEGEFAGAGAKLVNIADTGEIIVKAPFADNIAAQLKVGDNAKVLPTDVPGEEMNGRISLISSATDPASRTVEVWVTLGNEAGRLRANGAAQVTVSAQSKSDALVVPVSAVTLEASNAAEGTVMVVDATSLAHERKVTVGIRAADIVEVVSGLQAGETVVIEGNYALPDGTKVEVSEQSDNQPADSEEKKD